MKKAGLGDNLRFKPGTHLPSAAEVLSANLSYSVQPVHGALSGSLLLPRRSRQVDRGRQRESSHIPFGFRWISDISAGVRSPGCSVLNSSRSPVSPKASVSLDSVCPWNDPSCSGKPLLRLLSCPV